jgi:hypothetical protein
MRNGPQYYDMRASSRNEERKHLLPSFQKDAIAKHTVSQERVVPENVTKGTEVSNQMRGWVRCGSRSVLVFEVGFYICTAMCVLLLILLVRQTVIYQNDKHSPSCRLTFTDMGVISESEMQAWTVHEGWNLDTPFFDTRLASCVCSHSVSDQMNALNSTKIPLWIAPGDLVSLYRDGAVSKMPSNFVSRYSTAYDAKDHVKVCLPRRDLVTLWGDDYNRIRHCHTATVNEFNETVVDDIYVAFDGVLYCI